MKSSITVLLLCLATQLIGQTSGTKPVEEIHPTSHWWWIVGVLIAIAAGIGLYMLIKKDPRKDAV